MKKKYSIVPAMKKIAPFLLVTALLLPSAAQAEIKAGSVELSPFAGYNFFQSRQNLDDRPVVGGRVGYNITNHFGIEASGEFIRTKVDDKSEGFTKEGQFTAPIDGVDITMYDLSLLYHFMPDGKFNPYITAGYGAANYNPNISNKNMSVVDFGIGTKYWMVDNVALRLDVRDNMLLDERIHNIQTTLGIVFAFGGDKKNVETPASSSEVADITNPTVVFTSPFNGAKRVPVNQKTNVAFSEYMDPATITTQTFLLKQGSTSVSGTVASAGSTATFTPAHNYENDKTYTATVTTGAKDQAGNAMASNYLWEFNAEPAADTTPPTVLFTSPVNEATAVSAKQDVSAAFSENMDTATINATTFTLKQGTTPVGGKITTTASSATFNPSNKLEKGKDYTAVVTTGAKDLAGNAVAHDYTWQFKAYNAPKVIGVLSKLDNSHFDFNSAEISENGKTIINANIVVLKAKPDMHIRIAGYTSAAGTEEYNQDLSERRANSVKVYLVKSGVSANRLSTIGYGEKDPAKYEADPSDKLSAAALANMRVVIEIIEE